MSLMAFWACHETSACTACSYGFAKAVAAPCTSERARDLLPPPRMDREGGRLSCSGRRIAFYCQLLPRFRSLNGEARPKETMMP